MNFAVKFYNLIIIFKAGYLFKDNEGLQHWLSDTGYYC